MDVRRIKKEDMKKVIELLQSISFFYPDPNNCNEIWSSFIAQDHVSGFVFSIREEIVGYGAIVYETKIRGGMMAHVEDVAVNKHYRNSGIGKKIIQYLIDDANQKGCYKISLSCKSTNIPFYEKCGFISDGFTMVKIL